MNHRLLIHELIRGIRESWTTLFLTDITYKVIAFILLAPLISLFYRSAIALSGNSILADQDILYFFLGPLGWVCLICVGAPWLATLALGQSALLAVLARRERPASLVSSLRFAIHHALPVLRITARMIIMVSISVAPFLAMVAVVYETLLSDYDINFYLEQRPPNFMLACGIGVVLVVALLALLLRLISNWLFALPVVLFEDERAGNVLRVSSERAAGHRIPLLLWIFGWGLASLLLSAIATTLVFGFGRFIVPRCSESLPLLAASIGTTLLLWGAVNLMVNVLSTIAFAALLLNLYRQVSSPSKIEMPAWSKDVDLDERPHFRLTIPRIVAAGFLGVLVAILIGAVIIQSVRLEDHVQITAHRGASAVAPENTMAAVQKAIEDRADWVEIDVQETADGEVVVFHDSDFMKLAGQNLKIWEATMDDLGQIDIGSWFSSEFHDQRVPTLADVLDACKDKVGVNIELKYYGHDNQLVQQVAQIVDARDMASQVVVMSLKIDQVTRMKALRPDWKVGLLMSVAAGDLRNVNTDFLAVNARFATRDFVRRTHAMERQVFVWTVNDATTMSILIGRGVDNLITDKPELAREVLRQRAAMGPLQRLLLELAGVLGVEAEIGEL